MEGQLFYDLSEDPLPCYWITFQYRNMHPIFGTFRTRLLIAVLSENSWTYVKSKCSKEVFRYWMWPILLPIENVLNIGLLNIIKFWCRYVSWLKLSLFCTKVLFTNQNMKYSVCCSMNKFSLGISMLTLDYIFVILTSSSSENNKNNHIRQLKIAFLKQILQLLSNIESNLLQFDFFRLLSRSTEMYG